MADLRRIVWLASYPKSGNTWTRMFLANYLYNGEQPVPINQAHRFTMGDAIAKTYSMVARRSVDTWDNGLTLQLRNSVLRGIVANGADINFVKTHNQFQPWEGRSLIPKEFTRSAIYILRNPLDVVLSYSRHFGVSVEKAAEQLNDPKNLIEPTIDTVQQYIGSWSRHVEGWSAKSDTSRLVLRYEDMLNTPHESFGKLLSHIGIPVDQARLDKAIRFSSFSELSKQEKDTSFSEKSHYNSAFFAKGKSGQWKTDLAPELIKQIRKDHHETMSKFGYLDE